MPTENVEIFRENKWTTDGRIILEVTWADSVPLLSLPTDGSCESVVVGKMFNIRKIDGRIYCDTDVNVEAITVDIDNVDWQMSPGGDAGAAAGAGRISRGYVNTAENYCWKD